MRAPGAAQVLTALTNTFSVVVNAQSALLGTLVRFFLVQPASFIPLRLRTLQAACTRPGHFLNPCCTRTFSSHSSSLLLSHIVRRAIGLLRSDLGSDVKAVQPGRQGVNGLGFSTGQQDHSDGGAIDLELGLSGNASMLPKGSPEGLQDAGAQSSPSVHLRFQVAGFRKCGCEVFECWDKVDQGFIELEGWWIRTRHRTRSCVTLSRCGS